MTDKCNFRCLYCMPAEGLQWLPKSEILTYEEIAGVVGQLASSVCGAFESPAASRRSVRRLARLVRMLRAIARDRGHRAVDERRAPARAGAPLREPASTAST